MTAAAASSALALFVIRSTLLLTLALVLDHLLRQAPAVHRHRLWTLTFLAVLLLPALTAFLPVWQVPVPGWPGPVDPGAESTRQPVQGPLPVFGVTATGHLPASEAGFRNEPNVAREHVPAALDSAAAATAGAGLPSAPEILFALWLLGVAAATTTLAWAYHNASALERRARELTSPEWSALVGRIAATLGLRRRVRVRSEAAVLTPMAGGVFVARVLLPESAQAWGPERRQVVLTHELAHHAQHDPLRHLLARMALAVLWFHPLAWLGARQALLAREQACDERVIALGTRPSAYARQLLALAEQLTSSPSHPLTALPMVQRSLLEKRLMSILTADPSRRGFRGALGAALSVLLLGTITLAVAAPTQEPPPRPKPAPVAEPAPGPLVAVEPLPGPSPLAEPAPGPTPAAEPSPTTGPVPAATPEPAATTEPMAEPAPAAVPGLLPAAPSAPAAAQQPLTACAPLDRGASFSGTTSIRRRDSGTESYDRMGWSAGDRLLQTDDDGRRICALTRNSDRDDDRAWRELVEQGQPVWLEIRDRDGTVHTMELEGGAIQSWSIDGAQRPVDDDARRWRDATLDVIDGLWEITRVRGDVSTLRGRISTIRGQRSTLRGKISTLRGHVSTLKGQISSARGHESTLRGRISTLRGHVSTLRGAISSERGLISSLRATTRGATAEERSQIDERIARHEARIRELEDEIAEFDLDAKVAEVEDRIRQLNTEGDAARIQAEIDDFDLASKIAEVERELSGLDVEGRVEAIESEIEALDADRRIEAAAARLAASRAELARVLESIR